jgi:GxxExxY protein
MESVNSLCDRIRQTAYAIHVYYRHGHLEKVYENALVHRLRKLGLEVKQQFPVKVQDEDGTLLGEHITDLLVSGIVVWNSKLPKRLPVSTKHRFWLIYAEPTCNTRC